MACAVRWAARPAEAVGWNAPRRRHARFARRSPASRDTLGGQPPQQIGHVRPQVDEDAHEAAGLRQGHGLFQGCERALLVPLRVVKQGLQRQHLDGEARVVDGCDESVQPGERLGGLVAAGRRVLRQEDLRQRQLRRVEVRHRRERHMGSDRRRPVAGRAEIALPRGQLRLERLRQRKEPFAAGLPQESRRPDRASAAPGPADRAPGRSTRR